MYRYLLRRAAEKLAWLLLDHRPTPSTLSTSRPPDRNQVELRQWLASAGGLGGLQTYPHGVLYGLLLLTVFAWSVNFDRDHEGNWLMAVILTLPYCALAGYLAGRRTRSIWASTGTGGLTAGIGSAMTLATAIVLTYNLRFLMLTPIALTVTGFGLGFGAIGGAVSQPRMAWSAILAGLREW